MMLPARLPIPRFISASEIFCGAGAVGVLRALPAARACIIASGSLLRDPQLGPRLRVSCRAEDVLVLEAPPGEPALERLQPLLSELSAFGPDWIVAVGGGSVIDTAKVCWVFYEHPDLDLERAIRPFALPPLRGRCRLAAVPTTAGSGSEVSSAALFSSDDHLKRALVSHHLLPDLVILDPELTKGLPREAAAAAGLDALAHAVESYVSRIENPLADLFAEQAGRTLLTSLPRTIEDPEDIQAKLTVMSAAMMAGWVQNAKVPGVGHAIAHQLGVFGLSHGAATGAMLVAAMRFNMEEPAVRAKYDRLAGAVGLSDAGELSARIETLRQDLQGPNPLRTVEVADPDALTDAALEDMCARANPRPLQPEAILQVLEDARCRT